MALHHINPATGKPGICRATAGACPFGEELHGSSPQEVEAKYRHFVEQDDDPGTNYFAAFGKAGQITDEDAAARKATAPRPAPLKPPKLTGPAARVQSFLASPAKEYKQVRTMSKATAAALQAAAASPHLGAKLKAEGKTFNEWAEQAFTEWTKAPGSLPPLYPGQKYARSEKSGFGVEEDEIRTRLREGVQAAEEESAAQGRIPTSAVAEKETVVRDRVFSISALNFKPNPRLADAKGPEGEEYRRAASLVELHRQFQSQVQAYEQAGHPSPAIATLSKFKAAAGERLQRKAGEPLSSLAEADYYFSIDTYVAFAEGRSVERGAEWARLTDGQGSPVGHQSLGSRIRAFFGRRS